MKIFAVILVGGKGKRLRPLSTNARPKPFLSITKDKRTMFRKTVDRVKSLVPLSNIIVVANKRHKGLVKSDLKGIRRGNLILEPCSRNTAPAIAYAARIISKRCDDAVMVVLPADHYIKEEKKYVAALKKAVAAAGKIDGAIVTLGIKPTFAATQYGYIKTACGLPRPAYRGAEKVERFVEKPDLSKAKRFIKDKRFVWNAGMFITKASTMLSNIDNLAPDIAVNLKTLSKIPKLYRKMPNISIDYAVMEKAPVVYCVKGDFGWQDVGSFESLREILTMESRRFVERDGKVLKIL